MPQGAASSTADTQVQSELQKENAMLQSQAAVITGASH